MTTIKQWNGSAWETIVVGKQGPQGTQGIVQSATAPTDTGVLWLDTTSSGTAVVPTGGTTNQVLTKKSNTDYDSEWVSSGVPTGGTTGQLLTKSSNGNYDISWTTVVTDNASNLTSGILSTQRLEAEIRASARLHARNFFI